MKENPTLYSLVKPHSTFLQCHILNPYVLDDVTILSGKNLV